MRVEVRLFAACRERVGAERVAVELADATVAGLLRALGETYPSVAPLLAISRIAVNLELAPPGRAIAVGDELAVIPPVSGG